jgi:glyoxylase-like metal-dependent hydrolase (beta-lactamase superfamily II)
VPSPVRIVKIKLPIANTYVLLGERAILVDTGAPGDHDRIIAALVREGIALRDIALILLTHGHGDHAGSAAVLREITGAPVALHAADVDMARLGRNRPFATTRWTARLLKPFVDKRFDPFEPDVVLTGQSSLADFGADGHVIHTPGHTAGSISVLIGDEAIVGDVMMGGHLGGQIRPTQPRLHYFVEDARTVQSSIAQLIARAPRMLYVGHGGPLALHDVARTFSGIELHSKRTLGEGAA